MARSRKKACKACEAVKRIRARGVCDNCYQVLYAAVRAGTTTWQAIEKEGKCLPAGAVTQGRPRFAELCPTLATKAPPKSRSVAAK